MSAADKVARDHGATFTPGRLPDSVGRLECACGWWTLAAGTEDAHKLWEAHQVDEYQRLSA